MMPILAIDTAAQQCAVALLCDGMSFDRSEAQARGQSQRLLPLIQDLLREAGIGFGDLKAVAVTTGPGSFTGLRIGLAAAHGIALAQSIPAIGIDSFAAFWASLHDVGDMKRAVIVESRRAELYWQVLSPAGDPVTKPANELASNIAAALADQPVILCGDGARHLRDLMPNLALVDQIPGPSPLAIARLGLSRLILEVPQTLPQALYIRPADAKPARA